MNCRISGGTQWMNQNTADSTNPNTAPNILVIAVKEFTRVNGT